MLALAKDKAYKDKLSIILIYFYSAGRKTLSRTSAFMKFMLYAFSFQISENLLVDIHRIDHKSLIIVNTLLKIVT